MQEGLREPQGVRKVCKDTQRINGDGGRKSSWGVMRQFSREKDMYKGSFEMWRVRHVQSMAPPTWLVSNFLVRPASS